MKESFPSQQFPENRTPLHVSVFRNPDTLKKRHAPLVRIYRESMAARTPDRPSAAGVKPMWLAAPDEELPLPPLAVVLALPGLVSEPRHWYLPLMTSDGPCMSSKTLQELLMSAVDWRLNAPRLSLRAGRETLVRR